MSSTLRSVFPVAVGLPDGRGLKRGLIIGLRLGLTEGSTTGEGFITGEGLATVGLDSGVGVGEVCTTIFEDADLLFHHFNPNNPTGISNMMPTIAATTAGLTLFAALVGGCC